MKNTDIWDRLSVTDPGATKSFRRGGGFSGTDICPTWRMRQMTELFGPCGKGWGWDVEDHWSDIVEGANGTRQYAFVRVSVWWSESGKRYRTGSQIGGTEYGRAPDEAYKMAVTDAFGKCCQSLGLAADVYSGLFDDSKYQREAAQEHQRRKSWTYTIKDVRELAEVVTDAQGLDDLKSLVLKSQPPRTAYAELKEIFDGTQERLKAVKA